MQYNGILLESKFSNMKIVQLNHVNSVKSIQKLHMLTWLKVCPEFLNGSAQSLVAEFNKYLSSP